jgi:hypothetical protein
MDLNEATEAREELDRQIAALQAKRAALDVDPVLIEAREIVAHENRDIPHFAERVLAGNHDAHSDMLIALAALRRGMELARPAEAMDDAAVEALAQKVAFRWANDSAQEVAEDAIRETLKRSPRWPWELVDGLDQIINLLRATDELQANGFADDAVKIARRLREWQTGGDA